MKKLRLGMVGGGQGAFIGGVHRIASRIDGQWDLVAGALSSDADRAHASAAEIGIASDRSYADYNEMAAAESAREDGIDAVAIVTPNHLHAGPAIAFLRAGIHVICDKPLSFSVEDGEAVAAAVAETGKQFILTHNYTGYPLVRQAREMVQRGDLGDIRVINVEYVQDWLAEEVHNKQADWRADPARNGAGGGIADIGTHAFNLANYISGLEVKSLSADLVAFVPGRQIDDNAHVMLRYEGGAKGMLWASQVAVGNENALRLRIHGSKGGIEWAQENPNTMTFTRFGEPKQIMTRAGSGATAAGQRNVRVPPGHPEGYLEGFATIYTEAASLIRAAQSGTAAPKEVHTPNIADGVKGMRFIAACVASSANDAAWTAL
ncbi:Gfo/Idh/MocA family oxidoreductase [Marinovum sp. 2_MG-2023]|uniref:Gfo/Idh/MocA family protein n=1 Tax=unclassified Marinovum TaxID=2647166 RepID=UPI0026E42B31|nr:MULTISPECIES: Gfo/Idh/MocA family oxidoreductase [unclassified Marinovum]MDO6729403.1 Gfo/Idh/MocA family oxidoreductase [Marinovum sp. 2_MG-2023]MDO6781361.1 Gfo/Idh/MocA family oxidoreductase [Marinovum sp. 1_MG-2023]